jgi:hypothetical protein
MTTTQRGLQLLAAGEVIGALAGAAAGAWPALAAVPGLALSAAVQLAAAFRNRRAGGKAMALPVSLAMLCVLVGGWAVGLLAPSMLVLGAAVTGMAALLWNVASGSRYDRQSQANTAGTMSWAAQLEREISAGHHAERRRD